MPRLEWMGKIGQRNQVMRCRKIDLEALCYNLCEVMSLYTDRACLSVKLFIIELNVFAIFSREMSLHSAGNRIGLPLLGYTVTKNAARRIFITRANY